MMQTRPWIFTCAIAVILLAGVGALPAAAQRNAPGFAGSWIEVWPLVPDGRLPPTRVLQVAVTNQMLAVEEQLGDKGQHRRPPSYYPHDPQPVDGGVSADRAPRGFRWLAPDRLELREVAISPRGGPNGGACRVGTP
jgi:hypothetical protein